MLLKVFVFLFVFASVYLLRELILFILALRDEESAYKYKVGLPRLIGAGLSISYILTMLITGFHA